MNRDLTNTFRFFLDECLPPFLRDNKYFIYPFFYLAFRGLHISTAMNFKTLASTLSSDQYRQLYQDLSCISRDRLTDLNSQSIHQVLEFFSSRTGTLIDIGSPTDFFISKLQPTKLATYFSDLVTPPNPPSNFIPADILSLPFADNSFDYVTCFHTLEHIPNLDQAVNQLLRITKKTLVIAVPRQRYYYYTLDLHLHFFPTQESLTQTIGLTKFQCLNLHGDWLYFGYK